jgi:hypothetical protein
MIHPGVPTIRFAQKHGATNLLNLSTVAIFFSAVTATTLQISFDKTDDPLAGTSITDVLCCMILISNTVDAVNSFWFASLALSIAAAVNSLLGLTWKQAM